MISADNKRIAKGTMFLYVRKAMAIVIGLYTSRLLLLRLGVDDFGLFGLVGSLVTLFTALRVVFAGSVQRFINVAKAQKARQDAGSAVDGDAVTVREVFSLGVKIHRWMAVAFFAIVQIGGFILLPTLNISADNYVSAWLVFELTLLTTSITILTVPYDAVVLANERFNAYAAISLLEVFLKLGIVLMLPLWSEMRVVWYSVLLLAVAMIVRLTDVIYCRRAFGEECRYKPVRNKRLLGEMTRFAGWSFMGNAGYSLTNSGLNFVLNIFGGVVVNAARSVAYQVMNNVQAFVADLGTSFAPRSVMNYSEGKMDAYYRLMFVNSKVSFTVSAMLSFTLAAFAGPVLDVWLSEVPEYSVRFTQCVFMYALVRSLHSPIDTFFKAVGNLKRYQLTEFCIMVLNLPVSWIGLKLGMPYYGVFVVMTVLEVINLVAILLVAWRGFGFRLGEYMRSVMWRVMAMTMLMAVAFVGIERYGVEGLGVWGTIGACSVSLLLTGVAAVAILFDKTERGKLLGVLGRRAH